MPDRTQEDFKADMAARFVERSDTTLPEAVEYAEQVFNSADDDLREDWEREGWIDDVAQAVVDVEISYWED